MKALSLTLLLVSAVSFADQPQIRITAFSTDEITYTSTQTNLYTQLQFRWDIESADPFPDYRQSWHTFFAEGDTFMWSHTNTLSVEEIDWDAVVVQGGGKVFMRVVASSNRIPVTTTPYEMIVTNIADVAISNILITMGGANGAFETNSLGVGEGSPPFIFYLKDDWVVSWDHGRFWVDLVEGGVPKYYSFQTRGQQFTLSLTNGTYEVIWRDANK